MLILYLIFIGRNVKKKNGFVGKKQSDKPQWKTWFFSTIQIESSRPWIHNASFIDFVPPVSYCKSSQKYYFSINMKIAHVID